MALAVPTDLAKNKVATFQSVIVVSDCGDCTTIKAELIDLATGNVLAAGTVKVLAHQRAWAPKDPGRDRHAPEAVMALTAETIIFVHTGNGDNDAEANIDDMANNVPSSSGPVAVAAWYKLPIGITEKIIAYNAVRACA